MAVLERLVSDSGLSNSVQELSLAYQKGIPHQHWLMRDSFLWLAGWWRNWVWEEPPDQEGTF